RESSEHYDSCRPVRLRSGCAARFSATLVRIRNEQSREQSARRVAQQPSPSELFVGERIQVKLCGGSDREVIGRVRLENDAPRTWAAARAPGDLRKQLERPLRGAIVGQAEGDVGGDDGGDCPRRDGRRTGGHSLGSAGSRRSRGTG